MVITDRYTFAYKILPLVLAGEADEIPKLSQKCIQDMDRLGELYEQEWESRIKDEMDYSDGWNHLPSTLV